MTPSNKMELIREIREKNMKLAEKGRQIRPDQPEAKVSYDFGSLPGLSWGMILPLVYYSNDWILCLSI